MDAYFSFQQISISFSLLKWQKMKKALNAQWELFQSLRQKISPSLNSISSLPGNWQQKRSLLWIRTKYQLSERALDGSIPTNNVCVRFEAFLCSFHEILKRNVSLFLLVKLLFLVLILQKKKDLSSLQFEGWRFWGKKKKKSRKQPWCNPMAIWLVVKVEQTTEIPLEKPEWHWWQKQS